MRMMIKLGIYNVNFCYLNSKSSRKKCFSLVSGDMLKSVTNEL